MTSDQKIAFEEQRRRQRMIKEQAEADLEFEEVIDHFVRRHGVQTLYFNKFKTLNFGK